MSKIVKDSRTLKARLEEFNPWETQLLNRIYSTTLFDDVENHFKEQFVDYSQAHSDIISTIHSLAQSKYTEHLHLSYLDTLCLKRYSISSLVNLTSKSNSLNIKNHFHSIGYTFPDTDLTIFTPSLFTELSELESAAKGRQIFDKNSQLTTFLNLLTAIVDGKMLNFSFKFVLFLEKLKSSEKVYFVDG
jgi:hypothetical protein